jgi:hypothetical protein
MVTRVFVSMNLYRDHLYEWIVAGEGHLDEEDNRTGNRRLRVYLGRGATDCEYDSAYVLQLGLYGVRFRDVSYHHTRIDAFIPPDIRYHDFQVPKAGYDPFEGATPSSPKYGEVHPIVDRFVPDGDKDQWKLVRGKRVVIQFEPVVPKDYL